MFLKRIGDKTVLDHQIFLNLEKKEEFFGGISVKMNDQLKIRFMTENQNEDLKGFYEEIFFVSDRQLISKRSGETIDMLGWKKIYKCFLFPKEEVNAIEAGQGDRQMSKTVKPDVKRGTATSLSQFKEFEIKGKDDPTSVAFWMAFELKISDFVSQMNNNNPATQASSNNDLFINPMSKDTVLQIQFDRQNIEKLLRLRGIEQEQYVTFRVISTNSESVNYFKEDYLTEFINFEDEIVLPIYTP